MSLAVLELNDQSLLIQADGGALLAEPGFARLSPEGIETGEEARATAWREPQHSYNQYWFQLNQAPLAANQTWARHHADIAFTQLKQLWHGAGSPQSLMVLVPGSFTDSQLSLLLGMINALPCKVDSVIDNALAACFEIGGDTLFIDMQLHQTVLSVCRPAARTISIAEQEVFSDLGMMQIQNSVARHISNLLIDSYRYDPLHTSDNEQAIFNQIPGWLAWLRWEDEISDMLDTEQGELAFILRRQDVREQIDERLLNLRSFIARHSDCDLLLSHASALLAGLSVGFAEVDVAGQTVSMDNGFSIHPLLPEQAGGLQRFRSLDRGETGPVVIDSTEKLATHILCGHRALPLRKPVSIQVGEQGVELINGINDEAALTLVMRKRSLETVRSMPGVDVELPPVCRPGESIFVAGHRLSLIEVRNG